MSDGDSTPKEPATPLVEWSHTVLSFVLKGFVLLAALLAFLGLKEGALDRVLRNYFLGSVAVGLAIAVGVVGGTIVARSSVGRTRAIGTGAAAILVAVALGAALVMGVASKDTTDRPILKASVTEVDGRLSVSFEASASGLRHEEFLSVELEGLSSSVPVYQQVPGRFGSLEDHVESPPVKRDPADPTEEYVTRLTYRFVGGDVDGKAATDGAYTVPWGVYERVRAVASVIASSDPEGEDVIRCDRRADRRSCVAISLPPPPARPSLTPVTTGQRITGVTVAAEGMRTTQFTGVSVATVSANGTRAVQLAAQNAPGPDGSVTTTVPIPAPPKNGYVCVIASIDEEQFAMRTAPSVPVPGAPSSGAPPATVPSDGGANGAPRPPGPPCEAGVRGVTLEVR